MTLKNKILLYVVLVIFTLLWIYGTPPEKYYLEKIGEWSGVIGQPTDEYKEKINFKRDFLGIIRIPESFTKNYDLVFRNKTQENSKEEITITVIRRDEEKFWSNYADKYFRRLSEFSNVIIRDKNDGYSLDRNGQYFQLYPGNTITVKGVPVNTLVTFGTIPWWREETETHREFESSNFGDVFEVYAKPNFSPFYHFVIILATVLFWVVIINNFIEFFKKP